ncbi:hypothetical protein HRM2_30010 [Desulforapulum autotrophicum HRM2]|uniref:Uncharacterized protein n=1 Tax=Desulforapulum autotrophicum (strain ATCC 43914 / DSM 3382 / VKM B-1955 / HRM2) TaxID=177437 RepID=C0QK58_DESAH|nr:hypothetical protein [Desulforapulum autotrophicum]ACN16084.1 hypothetical protein HRM2_30010 [Desulforapulum autotrophicum HRM2]
MNPKKIRLFFISAILVSLFTVVPVSALDLPDSWKVNSTYLKPGGQNQIGHITWLYTRDGSTGENIVSVADASGVVDTSARLVLSGENVMISASVSTRVGKKILKKEGQCLPGQPVVMENTLIPCNWINTVLSDYDQEKVFNITRKVGDYASFIDTYRMRLESVTMEEAVDSGMILPEDSALLNQAEFVVVELKKVNPNGETTDVFTQLWSTTLPFWLYESTPFRVSRFVLK